MTYSKPLRPCVKIKPVRSERYLKFIRLKPCQKCFAPAPSDPAHQVTGGMGSKGSDLSCIALCRSCHSKEHSIGHFNFWRGHNRVAMIINNLDEFYSLEGKL